jgi:UTP--glucose-1-phosphate uridylyltransferase
MNKPNYPKVRKAVVTVAGYGTRMLPATKSMPKEMLPIVNKPVIQLIVEELVAAGIEQIIMITSWQKRAIEDHFDRSFELEHNLKKQHKLDLLKSVRDLNGMADFIYIRQKPQYGNGVPAITAKPILDNEPFLYVFGDDLVKSKVPFAKQLIDAYEATGCPVIGVQEVAKSDIHRYGIVETKAFGKHRQITSIIEKPSASQTKSKLASFGRYLLTPDNIHILESTKTGKGGELWLADGLKKLIKQRPVIALPIANGQWLTTGDPTNWLKTNLEYALDDKECRDDLVHYLKQKLIK